MSSYQINNEQGPHAAANLSDADVRYLAGVVLWELAVRSHREDFVAYLHQLIEQRDAGENQLESIRHQRDLMCFAAEVMFDIQQLPETEDETHDQGTGLYL